jgi:hypothetical protein
MGYKLNLFSIITANMTVGAIAPAVIFASPVQSDPSIMPSMMQVANAPNPYNKIIAQNSLKGNIDDIIIDRDPIPIAPPPQANPPKSLFIPNNSPTQVIPKPSAPQPITPFKVTNPNPVQSNSIPSNLPYKARIAALVPPPAIDTAPYLVVIPSSDVNILNQVRSVISTAKFIPSRFGYIIMVQGYPDRDRAEVLKTIVRSEMGLDARLVHQNNL